MFQSLKFILISSLLCSFVFTLSSCSKKELGLRPEEKSIEAQIEELIDEEKSLDDVEINEYFRDLVRRFRRVYLNNSYNSLKHKKDALELLLYLSNSRLQYFNASDSENAEKYALKIIKNSMRRLRFIKKRDIDFGLMELVNYYADSSVFLDKGYLKNSSKKLFVKILDELSNPEGFFLYRQGDDSYPDMDDNSFALLSILKLYRISQDLRYLEKASRLAEQIIDKLGGVQINIDLVQSLLYLYNFTNDSFWLETASSLAEMILDDPDSYHNVKTARFMNYLYYFLDEPKFRTFAETTYEDLIKEDLKADTVLDFDILLLKLELEREPIYLKLEADDLSNKKSEKFLDKFLDYPSNFYLINMSESERNLNRAKVCIDKQCSDYFSDDDELEEYLSSI